MKISRLLRLLLVMIVAVTLTLGTLLAITYRTIEAKNNIQAIVSRILHSTAGLNLLIHEYLVFQEPRAVSQWQGEYGDMAELLTRLKQYPGYESLYDRMERQQQRIGGLFQRLQRIRTDKALQEGGAERQQLAIELEQRIQTELMVETHALSAIAFRLNGLSLKEVQRAGWRAAGVGITAYGVLALLLAAVHPLFRRWVAAPLRRLQGGAKLIGEGYLSHRINLRGDNELAELAGSFDEMASHLQRRLRLQKATAQVSAQFLSSGEPDFTQALGNLGEAVEVNRAYLFRLREDGRTFDNTHEWCAAGTSAVIEQLQGLDLADFPYFNALLRTPEGFVVEDVQHMPPQFSAEKEIFELQGIRALMCMPILSNSGELRGFIGFDDTQSPRRWERDDREVLRTVAEVIGGVWQQREASQALRRSQEELQRLGAYLEEVREQEKKSIAHEIHDELGSLLTKMKMDLALWPAEERNDAVNQRLAMQEQWVNEAVRTVRRIAISLRPKVLDQFGLLAALEFLAKDMETHARIPCRVAPDSAEPILPDGHATALFRICQEALTNVARHAQASAVEIRLELTESEVILSVTDDGVGIAPEALTRLDSFGLGGMRERAKHFGGISAISRRPEGGSRVEARLPLPAPPPG
ncbi:MAG: GAF domain-containing protein [Magnetococcales bacterium]|nr:GAF domain-containing protein [Magnetococcales bacterium]